MQFSDIHSAIAWALTKAPEDKVMQAQAKYREMSEKHGTFRGIHAGIAHYDGLAEDELGLGPAIEPFNYIWLTAVWDDLVEPGKQWHLPIHLKMERELTLEERCEAGGLSC